MSFKKRYAALLLTVFAVAYNVAFFKESYVQFKRRSLNELPFPINFQDESIGKESFWKIDDVTYQIQPPCLPGIFTYYIKSHHTKGFQRREHIRKTWGRDRSIIFILLNTEPFIKAQEGTFQPPADIEEEDLLKIEVENLSPLFYR